jgi:hypothetical protein
MKHILYFAIAAALIISAGCKRDAAEKTGSIYGVITDKATGEPIKSASVQLNPLGTKYITGSDGQYEFADLKVSNYTIDVTKTGYADLKEHAIKVEAGKSNKGDAQLEKLPPALRVTNSTGQDITELNLGESAGVTTANFNIFNDGEAKLEWDIVENSEWIIGVSRMNGTLDPTKSQGIIVTIDRDKLDGGSNTTKLYINSNDGNKEITVSAVGAAKQLPVLNTLTTTNLAARTATFNGKIINTGSPRYTERGFVYATTTMPTTETTIAKLTASVTDNAEYSVPATGLTLDQTYYVRAYAINTVGTAYSTNEDIFTATAVMPTLTTQAVTNINIGAGTATFNGKIVSSGDLPITEKGFVYRTAANPTLENAIKKVVQGGTDAFSAPVTELEEGNTYYVCAYITNSKTTVYGTQVSVDFNAVMPQVTTQAVTGITGTTATFNGSIATVGDPAYTERGFVYSTYQNPTIDDGKIIVDGSSIGIFITEITELTEGTTYYVRAYASNGNKVEYGAMVNFVAVNPEYVTLASLNIAVQTADIEPPVSTAASATSMCQYGRVGGYSDWRLPTTTELQTIYNVKNSIGGFKEELYWTGIGPGMYVCSPGVVQETNQKVDMTNGSMVGCVSGSTMVNVRCVRSLDGSSPTNNWTVGNIQVQQTDAGEADRPNAITVCDNSGAEGYTDWRLPTKEEMSDMYLNRSALGDFFSANYWTSSYSPGRYDCPIGTRPGACRYIPAAYYSVDFYNGGTRGNSTTSEIYKIRCVRTLP